LGVVFVLACGLALSVGSVRLGLWRVFTSGLNVTERAIVLYLRLPRVLLAGFVGAALAISGGVFQALLRNPLADPYVLGVSSGSAVGAILAIMAGYAASGWWLPFFAFLGALATVGVVYLAAQVQGRVEAETLLLAGVVTGAFFSAVIMFLLSVAPRAELQGIIFWLMGDLSAADYSRVGVVAPYVLAGAGVLWCYASRVNLLLLGEEEASALGVEVEGVKLRLYVLASLLTGAAVSVCGVIGFVGLIVPHTVRLIWGNDYRLLLPACFLLGGAFLVLADGLARWVLAPLELPVGVVTAACGAPFFIYLLRRRRRG